MEGPVTERPPVIATTIEDHAKSYNLDEQSSQPSSQQKSSVRNVHFVEVANLNFYSALPPTPPPPPPRSLVPASPPFTAQRDPPRKKHARLYKKILDPRLVERLQQKDGKYKKEIIENLMRTMNDLIIRKIESLSKEQAELQLMRTQPGTYLLRASTSELDHVAICTHITEDQYVHEILGPPLVAAERLYRRMTEAHTRTFELQGKTITTEFHYYLPYSIWYVANMPKQPEDSYHYSLRGSTPSAQVT